ncbi:carbohydrate-binding module family 50 protein [Penicillium waksmanii]|uniref:carbohydrate-binding module family 50 protein n=1 Tax=Penicillium waksmanii TaxID=69791 RepID=UPI0025467D54|nr:carbohydrate-binding module family 50 protein [Penicillium waksmanii]KAJ5983120.1 carbohydrate-binding module family 50 protein [Penicillium waksmanii]
MRSFIPLALAALVQAGNVPSQEAIAQTGDILTDPRDHGPTVWKHIDMISVPFVRKIYPNNRPIIPIADGTREDCAEYSWYKDYEFPGQEIERDCWGIAHFHEVTPEVSLSCPSLDTIRKY